ncbi:MAG: toxin TcdB middle/N-terminal domain-containing protein [Polyangiales bacterium]
MRILVCVLAILVAVGATASAQDRSGVRPEVLSIPSGPGSIEGLGEAFEPNANTGTSSYGVDVVVPPGVAGFVPSIGIHYSSGAGNGEVGIGWSVGLPMLQRGTDRGLPRYDATDRIVLRGMQGRGAEDLVQLADGSYRFRIEGAFVRGRQRSDGSWDFYNRSGVRFRLGGADTATIASGTRVFAWLLTEQVDTHGNRIAYEYQRDATGHPYLSRIVYNDFSATARNEIRFEYEDRPDVVTSYVPTFADTIARRLVRIVVVHGGATVRTYDLAYASGQRLSRLGSVTLTGSDGTTKLPTLRLDYAAPTVSAMRVVSMASAPARSLGTVAELDDVDGDALPDLLVTDPALDGGAYSYYPNLDGTTFGARTVLASSPSVWLSSTGVQLADMDGDGASDVVARVSSASDGFRFYPGGSAGGFGGAVTIAPNPSFGFEDPDVRLVDLDHDRRTDWMRIDPTTGTIYLAYNRGNGTFESAPSLPPVDASEVVAFSKGARFADCNGDGLQDLVLLRSQSLRCYLGKGFGAFTAATSFPGAPVLSNGELAETEVRDVDGDGLADLVHVGVSQVRFWPNHGSSLGPVVTVTGTPSRGVSTLVRVADMNGNGSADVVWIDPTNTSAPWRYLDFLADGTPGLVTRIDNGLGKVVTIEYAGMGEVRGYARGRGLVWTHRSPIGQTVVSRIVTSDSLGNDVETLLHYADGYFDGGMREFRGFAYAETWALGDADQPTHVTEATFDLGEAEEARKGLPLTTTSRTDSGSIFHRETFTHVVRTLLSAANGTPIRYAFESQEDIELFEGAATPVLLRKAWDQDDYGNVVLEASYGQIQGNDLGYGADEVVTRRTFATNPSTWVVDRVASERIESLDGTRLSETRTYYDGDALVGLPLGQVTSGHPARTESLVDGTRFADVTRVALDDYGNVVKHYDARGSLRELDYDAGSHTFVTAERRQVDGTRFLEWTAEFDHATGGMRSITDPNGAETRFVYDALARLVAIAEPGDTEADPSRSFAYVLGAPLSHTREETKTGTGDPLVSIHHFDGLGRSRANLSRADGGRWVVAGASVFGARGEAALETQPFFAGSADLPTDLVSRPGTAKRYDATGRVVEETEPDGSKRQTTYAPLVTNQFDEDDLDPTSPHHDTPTTLVSDGLGRLVRVVERDGARDVITRYGYDARGNLTSLVDANGHARAYTYDARSRRVGIVDPNAGTWGFSFTDGDDLDVRTDPVGHQIRFVYDLLGRKTEEWHRAAGATAESRVSALHYDAAAHAHRELGNLEGQLAWVEDAGGSVFFGYDPRGRHTDTIRRWSSSEEHGTFTDYDRANRPSRRGFPDGSYLAYGYDARGLMASVGPVVTSMTWTAAGALDTATFGNGVTDHWTYDARLRPERLVGTDAGGKALRALRYDYDRASKIRSITDERPDVAGTVRDLSAAYTYDDRYRMVREVTPRSDTAWAYDDVGNFQTVASTGTTPLPNLAYQYPAGGAGPDRPQQVNDETFGYDDAGRMLRDGARVYTWDAKGRLARVERGDVVEEYVYDFEDRRVEKRTTRGGGRPEVTRYVDNDAEIRGGRLVRYAFAHDRRVARLDSVEGLAMGSASALVEGRTGMPMSCSTGSASRSAWALLFAMLALLVRRGGSGPSRSTRSSSLFAGLALQLVACGSDPPPDLRDHARPIEVLPDTAVLSLDDLQETPLVHTDVAGVVVSESDVHPYGAERFRTGAGQVYGFVGNETDVGTGLGDFHARPYRADLGVFVAPDPVAVFESVTVLARPAALAPVVYGQGDPIDRSDRSGEYAPSVHARLILNGIWTRIGHQPGHSYSLVRASIERVQREIDLDQSAAAQPRHAMYGVRLRELIRMPGGLRANREALRTQAIRSANEFVRSELASAARALAKGNVEYAYRHLGRAAHTLTDGTSPAHEGFIGWNPNRGGMGIFRGGIHHGLRELGMPTGLRADRAEGAAAWAFDLMMELAGDPTGHAAARLQQTNFFGEGGATRGRLLVPARYTQEARMRREASGGR